jgi:putative NIF3 family GTP cyclohydrolase 1 type 2
LRGADVYFPDVKVKLMSLFQYEKLDGRMDSEWGFNNEIEKDVSKIGYATNLSPETIHEAIKKGVDLIVTHHDAWPFVFGMKESCLSSLKRSGIAHAFFHAPLDDADFGTSAALANALKLMNCYRAIPYEGIYLAGVIGVLQQPTDFECFEKELSAVLCEPIKAFKNNNKPVEKVCVVTGAGNMTTDIKIAIDNNCDTFVTGEYNLYSQQYSRFKGINLMIGSHTNTEIMGVSHLVNKLIESTDIEAVRLSEESY